MHALGAGQPTEAIRMYHYALITFVATLTYVVRPNTNCHIDVNTIRTSTVWACMLHVSLDVDVGLPLPPPQVTSREREVRMVSFITAAYAREVGRLPLGHGTVKRSHFTTWHDPALMVRGTPTLTGTLTRNADTNRFCNTR